ncbi:MAG: NTP transferase domain-containing protein [Lachnospiraceae bacterium]|nr:NTP transferase domain-containing protein [Lachnospiraceae bacterium]
MNYLSVKETAQRWGVSPRRVHQYCKEERVPGAKRLGNAWAIPENAVKPQDPRRRKKIEKVAGGEKKVERVGAVIAAAGIVDEEKDVSPLMHLGKISIIRRMVLIFQQVKIFPIVVITGYQALEVEQHLSNYGVIFVENKNYKTTDKLESAKMGFHFLEDKCDKVFFTSVNVPMFTAETLRKMLEVDGEIVVPSFQGKNGHPVLLGWEAIRFVNAYQGDGGVRGAIESSSFSMRFLDVEDEGVLLISDSMERIDNLVENHNARLLHPFVKIQIEREGIVFDGRAKLLLLLIQETNSVQTACRQIAMSRGKAWDMINQMEEELGFAVVTRRQGGSHGGKTELTEKGKSFLQAFLEYENMVKNYAAEQFQMKFGNLK